MGTATIGPLTGPVNYSDGSSGTVTFPAQTVPTSAPPDPGGGGLPLPPGYAEGDLIWSEPFSRLDTNKWQTWMGDAQWGRWSNRGTLPDPLSAMNSGGNMEEYYDPSQLAFGSDGLVITAIRNTSQSGYTWKSGAMCTEGKWKTPLGKTALFRIVAQCPDMATGAWPAWWHLDGGAEIDMFEGGFTPGGIVPNRVLATTLQPNNPSIQTDAGTDLSKSFVTYDHEYVPGQSITSWTNGIQKACITKSVPSGQYELIINLQIASSHTQGWHTVVSNATPNPSILRIKSLRVYSHTVTALGRELRNWT